MTRLPWVHRLLIRLHPRRFRETYGAEMADVVGYRLNDGRRGRTGIAAWVGTLVDLTSSVVRAWMPARSGRHRHPVMPDPQPIPSHSGALAAWALDTRFVLRALRRSPGYSMTSIAVLAGAVAVNAAVFSFVRGTLLAPPTYPDAERVVIVWGSNTQEGQLRDVISGPTYVDLRARMTSLDALAAFHPDNGVLLDDERPRVIDVNQASVDFFRAVPVEPEMGRVFDDRERTEGSAATILVSNAYWVGELGGDPGVIGRSVPLDGESHEIIGVLPKGFHFLADAPIWTVLSDDLLAADGRYRIHYHLVGHLRQGVTPTAASQDLSAAMHDIATEWAGLEGWDVLVESMHGSSVMAVRPALRLSAAAALLVLFVALVNLATLFRIRTLRRHGEFAVRSALGSGRSGIGRLLILEAGALGAVGAVLGLAATPLILARIRTMVPQTVAIPDSAMRVPSLQALFDPWVGGVVAAAAVLGAIALALPALRSVTTQGTFVRGARSGLSRTKTRGLVITELALATVLVLGGLLLEKSTRRMLATDLGLEPEGLLTLYFGNVWAWEIPDQVTYFDRVTRAVESLPEVESVGLIDYLPFLGEDDFARVYFLNGAGDPVRDLREEWRRVDDGLIGSAGMRLIRGRAFEPNDLRGPAGVAVINETFAKKHFPNGDPVGQRVSTHEEAYTGLEIVGVVADVRSLGPTLPAPPLLYVPLQGAPRGTTGMYVRVRGGPPMAMGSRVRDAIWSVDPTQPIAFLNPMTDLAAQWVAIPRAIRTLVSGLAVFSLLLAALGVFGVVAFLVQATTADIGVRVALGASPVQIRRGIVKTAVPVIVAGVVSGLVVGLLAAKAASSLLFDVEPTDPLAAAAALTAMAGVAFLASYVPARRASRIDPADAIRGD